MKVASLPWSGSRTVLHRFRTTFVRWFLIFLCFNRDICTLFTGKNLEVSKSTPILLSLDTCRPPIFRYKFESTRSPVVHIPRFPFIWYLYEAPFNEIYYFSPINLIWFSMFLFFSFSPHISERDIYGIWNRVFNNCLNLRSCYYWSRAPLS